MDGKTKPALPEGFEPNFEDGELTTSQRLCCGCSGSGSGYLSANCTRSSAEEELRAVMQRF
jgi:hypothetical protein